MTTNETNEVVYRDFCAFNECFESDEELMEEYPEWTQEALDTIRNLKREDIKSVKLGEDWLDDHELCVEVLINDSIGIVAMWIVRDFYKDLVRAETGSESGIDDLYDYIRSYVEEPTDNC